MIFFKQPLFAALIIMLFSNSIAAKVKIPFGEREVLNKVYDLPNTDEFKLKDGNFMDLARIHKEFNIAYFLPLYIIEEPKIAGYDEKTETFYDLSQNEIDEIIASQKLNKENLLQLPFYTKYGGKLVAVLIIGLLIWGSIPSKKDKVQPRNV